MTGRDIAMECVKAFAVAFASALGAAAGNSVKTIAASGIGRDNEVE